MKWKNPNQSVQIPWFKFGTVAISMGALTIMVGLSAVLETVVGGSNQWADRFNRYRRLFPKHLPQGAIQSRSVFFCMCFSFFWTRSTLQYDDSSCNWAFNLGWPKESDSAGK